MKFTSLFNIISIVVLSASTVRGDVVGFSGNTCDGDEGLNDACQEECIRADTRQSVLVLADGPHCLTFFEDKACSINVGSVVNPGAASCTTFDTGTAVNSFKCAPNAVCAT